MATDQIVQQDAAVMMKEAPAPASSQRPVRAYDFRRPRHLSNEQLRNMQRVHAAAAQAIEGRLGRYLGVNLAVRLEGTEELAYGLLSEALPEYAYGNILDLAPLNERGLLTIDAPLCLAFVDRVLGGFCKVPGKPRPLTAVDQAATESTIEMILRCLRDAWKEVCPAKLSVVERRVDARQVALVAPGEPVLMATFLVTGDLGEHRIRLCVPVGGLKNVAEGSTQRATATRPGPEQAAALRGNILKALERASLPVVATVGSAELSLGALMQLKAGDVVRLDQPAESPVLVSVAGRRAYIGKMGLKGRRKAVQVTGRIDSLEE